MPASKSSTNIDRSEHYGAMQRIVDALFYEEEQRVASTAGVPAWEEEEPFTVRRLDVVIAAETADLPEELMRIVNLLPPGNYTRQRLCDQINSAITGHAWGQVYGTVS